MSDLHRTIIVTAAHAPLARKLCASLGEGPDCFMVGKPDQLIEPGQTPDPALYTHYVSSGDFYSRKALDALIDAGLLRTEVGKVEDAKSVGQRDKPTAKQCEDLIAALAISDGELMKEDPRTGEFVLVQESPHEFIERMVPRRQKSADSTGATKAEP